MKEMPDVMKTSDLIGKFNGTYMHMQCTFIENLICAWKMCFERNARPNEDQPLGNLGNLGNLASLTIAFLLKIVVRLHYNSAIKLPEESFNSF